MDRVLTCPDETFARDVLTLGLEVLRYLTYIFLGYSNRPRDYTKFPPMMDMAWRRTSPVSKALQYLSELMNGTAPRLRLLFAPRGYPSFVAWQRACPLQIRFCRRLFLMITCGLAKQHQHVNEHMPWVAFSIGDRRRPMSDRERLATWVKTRNSCCTPPGIVRDIVADGAATVAALLGFVWEMKLFMAAWELYMSLSIVERTHARNRANADGQMSWHNFASSYVNDTVRQLAEGRAETDKLHKAADKVETERLSDVAGPVVEEVAGLVVEEVGDEDPPADPPAAVDVVAAALEESSLIQMSPFHLFRREWLRQQRAMGRHIPNCATPSVWKEAADAFDELRVQHPQRHDSFTERSESSKRNAKEKRKQLKHKTLQDAPGALVPVGPNPPPSLESFTNTALALPPSARPADLNTCLDSTDASNLMKAAAENGGMLANVTDMAQCCEGSWFQFDPAPIYL